MQRRHKIYLSLITGAAMIGLPTAGNASSPSGPASSEQGTATPGLPSEWPSIPRAPQGAPNIVLILTDDVGFGAASTFGGPVPTPNLDRLAQTGLTYNRFHTTAMCSPTRAALLTGRNQHRVATGALTDFAFGAPGYSGQMPKSAATIAKILRDGGYNTAFVGKHHNVPDGPFGTSGPFDYWPTNMGFEYFFGFVGSDTDQFRPTLYKGTERVVDRQQSSDVLDARLSNKAIEWLHRQKGAAPEKPFFLYYAPGSAHMPHQAPAEWLAKFRGKFDYGWQVQRERTLALQKKKGLVPPEVQLPEWPDDLPAWESLSAQEQEVQQRMMEAFAASLAYQDAQIGRLLDELERMGQSDNTLIVFIEGDNGPDAAGSPDGSFAEAGELANKKLSQDEHYKYRDRIGGPLVHSNFSSAWALATATPFPYYKQIASHLGGTRNGMIISWPARIDQPGLRTQYGHVIDIVPTLLDAAKIPAPAEVDGVAQMSIDGIDLSYSFDAPQAPDRRKVQYYEITGNRAIYADGWLASTVPMRAPWQTAMSDWAQRNHAGEYEWQLFHLTNDFNQTNDLSQKMPDKLAEMKALFASEAERNGVEPIMDTPRYRLSSSAYDTARNRYEYWGKGLSMLTNEAPPFFARAFTLNAEITGGEGVLMAYGSFMGGWAFYLKDGKPAVHMGLSPLPEDQFDIVSPVAIEAGKPANVTFDFAYDGNGFGKGGTLSIAIDGKAVASRRIERTIVVVEGNNENFDIGFDGGVPVVEALGMDNGFTGTLKKLTLDTGPIGQSRKPADK